MAASDTLVHWTQEGHKGDALGNNCFTSNSGLYSISLQLEKSNGLYYCPMDVYTVGHDPVRSNIPKLMRMEAITSMAYPLRNKRYILVSPDCLTESEV